MDTFDEAKYQVTYDILSEGDDPGVNVEESGRPAAACMAIGGEIVAAEMIGETVPVAAAAIAATAAGITTATASVAAATTAATAAEVGTTGTPERPRKCGRKRRRGAGGRGSPVPNFVRSEDIAANPAAMDMQSPSPPL
mmetsp:Transcript_22746/g.35303  ORF Transcript_22746/g.35303 Transcript_22746/m.35303 type:complete len:139 (+) Transcript_22746:239-655(+)